MAFALSAGAQSNLAIARALLSRNVRDYADVKASRSKLLLELQDLWGEHDGTVAQGGDTAALSSTASREAKIRGLEAQLSNLLRRGDELRVAIAEQSFKVASLGRMGSSDYTGRWRLAFEGTRGTIELTQTGAFLSGSYDLPSLSSGTFIGYGGGSRISLMLLGNQGGLFATLEGHPESSTVVRGTYLRRDLASGTPAEGDWSMESPAR